MRKWTELKRHHVPKLLTIYRSPLGRSYNRLYVTRKERGRGRLSNEDSAQAEIEGLSNFVASSKEKVIEAVA